MTRTDAFHVPSTRKVLTYTQLVKLYSQNTPAFIRRITLG